MGLRTPSWFRVHTKLQSINSDASANFLFTDIDLVALQADIKFTRLVLRKQFHTPICNVLRLQN